MTTESKIGSSSSHGRRTRRYWRAADTPKPWVPWGIVQLIWLLFLFVLGAIIMAPTIEADVRTNVSNRLNGAGANFTELSADGQIISIVADGSNSSKTALQAIADSTKCRTWAGQLPCPTTVNVSMRQSVELPVVVDPRPHGFMIERVEDAVTLSGEVPSIAEERRILDTANQHFSDVTNKLSVSNEVATAGYASGTNLAITTVSHLGQGHAKWSGDSLSVLGFASVEGIDLARQQFERLGDDSLRGDFNVHALDTRPSEKTCDQRFAEQLSNSSILFNTSSANIDPSSNASLDVLAELALECPGNLLIGGHTDSRGDDEMNKSLSHARANTVLAALISRGVTADRLSATGFGEEQPIAGNETSDGRAANRRITINVQDKNQ